MRRNYKEKRQNRKVDIRAKNIYALRSIEYNPKERENSCGNERRQKQILMGEEVKVFDLCCQEYFGILDRLIILDEQK